MGDYASLRFRVKLTEEAHMAIVMAKQIYCDETNRIPFWEIVRSQGIKIPRRFYLNWRSSHIPFGGAVREDWGEQCADIAPATHRWNVVCASKDVKMMELFCEEVLPLLIAEPCTAELLYEHWDESRTREVMPKEDHDRSEEG